MVSVRFILSRLYREGMKRKAIQLAGKTLVVSLPSKWARRYGVRKGAEVEMEERGRQIVLSTETESDVDRISMDVSGLDVEVVRRWLLPSLHKRGYDEIEIKYENDSFLKAIQETISDTFIGFAIVEQTKTRCLIRIVAREQEKEFDALLRRAFLVTKSLGEGISEYLRDGRLKELKDLLSLERTNNQLTNFCERILNKKGHRDFRKTCFAYVVAWNLEKICDDYKTVCNFLSRPENSSVKLKDVIGMLGRCNAFFAAYYSLFYKFRIGDLKKLNDERKELEVEFERLIKKNGRREAIVLGTLQSFVVKISDLSASYIALNVD